jgi:hypothetical protein
MKAPTSSIPSILHYRKLATDYYRSLYFVTRHQALEVHPEEAYFQLSKSTKEIVYHWHMQQTTNNIHTHTHTSATQRTMGKVFESVVLPSDITKVLPQQKRPLARRFLQIPSWYTAKVTVPIALGAKLLLDNLGVKYTSREINL